MKKQIIFSVCLVLMISHAVWANSDCIVIGFHQPNTNTYMGPTWCNQVNTSNIIVYGPLTSNNSQFSGNSEVDGPLQSTDSCFETIIVKDKFTSQKVVLNSNSQVKGDIQFFGPSGIVYVDHTSKITGKVINGKIVSK